jgi:hypothetical protein
LEQIVLTTAALVPDFAPLKELHLCNPKLGIEKNSIHFGLRPPNTN